MSSKNYYGNTSPAYGNLLQWPNQWILPPKLHTAAKTRTEYLGLSSLDLQAMEDQRQREHSAAVAAGHIPRNFIQRPRETVTGLLGRTAQQNHFRIDALTGEFFEPLEAMLGQKKLLLGSALSDTPTSLDCVALGYLALALIPDLEFPWLRDAMRAKAPRLTAYTERMRLSSFGETPVEIAHAFTPESASPSFLPWRAPGRISVASVGSTLLATLADSTPFLSEVRRNNRLKQAAESSDSGLNQREQAAVSKYADASKKDMYVSIASVVGGVAALVGYVLYTGLVSFSHGEDEGEWEEVLEEVQEEEVPEAQEVEELGEMKATDFLAAPMAT